uniref:Uncharacterized protein n=1 Tax=Strigamia maritima TaxID=126957 RepID=T1IRL0_STRMM
MASHWDTNNKFNVVMINGPKADGQDFLCRVLTTIVKISFKSEMGMAAPKSIISSMARGAQTSVNDRGFRRKVASALVRGMENKLISLKNGQFKLTKRTRVVADNSCNLWLKIPTFLPKRLDTVSEIKKKPPKKCKNFGGERKFKF